MCFQLRSHSVINNLLKKHLCLALCYKKTENTVTFYRRTGTMPLRNQTKVQDLRTAIKAKMATHNDADQMPMSSPYYQAWYDMIVDNQAEQANQLLKESDPDAKRLLLNGKFIYGGESGGMNKKKDTPESNFMLNTALCLAATSGSIDVLEVLITAGADVYNIDIHKFNILHSLVGISVFFPDQEEFMVGVYQKLCQILDDNQLRKLYQMEDYLGFLPLELAAKQGAFRLMMAFFETPGVYLRKTEKRHSFKYKYYDITDYELGSKYRWLRSPLVQLVYMEWGRLHDPYTKTLFQENSLIHLWVKKKQAMNGLLLFMWFLLRMSYFIVYYIFDSDEKWITDIGGVPAGNPNYTHINHSSNITHFKFCDQYSPVRSPYVLGEFIYLMVYWGFSSMVDCLDLIMVVRNYTYYKHCKRTLRGSKDTMDRSLWYQFANSIAVQFIGLSTRSHFTKDPRALVNIARVVATLCAVWSPLFFIQALPKVGHFVSTIQRMMVDLFRFLVVFVVILIPFTQMLLVFVNTNSTQGCITEFSSFPMSFYSVILVMQNMLDFTQFEVDQAYVLYFVHIALVFALPVVLINFLIAVMSSSVSIMDGLDQTLSDLQFVMLSNVLELRFRSALRFYYNWAAKKHFWHENGRLYIRTVEPIAKTNAIPKI